jgi:hypothetical protein
VVAGVLAKPKPGEGVSPATIQGIAAGTAVSTENGLTADTANDATI